MDKITFQHRLKSMTIDFCIICITGVPLIILIFILKLENSPLYQISAISLLFSIFLCKDLIGGGSLGNRIAKLKVVSSNKSFVTPLKLILRNIFVFIWPVEILMCFINPEKKFGDIVFGTKVVQYDNRNTNPVSLRGIQVFFYFSITLIILFIIFYSIFQLLIKSNDLLKLLYI
jgi:uncharacterized RDD family membrane protein YckC